MKPVDAQGNLSALIPQTRNRNIVIVRAGPASLHPEWLRGGPPDFDLLVTAYDDNAPVAEGEFRFSISGTKVAGYAKLFEIYPDIFSRYDRIALLDDDISTNAIDINKSFSIGESLALDVWQPSLSLDSYYTYSMLINNDIFSIRYTDFIEMMCPFFSSKALRGIIPLFSLGYETGIDLLWCSQEQINLRKVAVLDEIFVRHTRPIGTTQVQQGFTEKSQYVPQIHAFLAEKGARFYYPQVIVGTFKNGNSIGSGAWLDLLHLWLLRGLAISPHNVRYVFRSLYHQMGFGLGATRKKSAAHKVLH